METEPTGISSDSGFETESWLVVSDATGAAVLAVSAIHVFSPLPEQISLKRN